LDLLLGAVNKIKKRNEVAAYPIFIFSTLRSNKKFKIKFGPLKKY
jgi:hypothetical protein